MLSYFNKAEFGQTSHKKLLLKSNTLVAGGIFILYIGMIVLTTNSFDNTPCWTTALKKWQMDLCIPLNLPQTKQGHTDIRMWNNMLMIIYVIAMTV